MIPRCLTSRWRTEDSLQRSWPASLQSDTHWRKCIEVVQSVEAQSLSTSWSWLWPCLWVSQNLLSLLSACRLWPSSAAERMKSYFRNQWTAKRSQCSSWFDCSYFNHSVSLEVLPILLRLMRLVVHVHASNFRLSTTTVLLHSKQRVWRQMDFFIVSSRECCLHLEMLGGKNLNYSVGLRSILDLVQ